MSAVRLRCGRYILLAAMVVFAATSSHSQTSTTGALIGVVFDPSGSLVNGADMNLTKRDTREKVTTTPDDEGRFGFSLLAPGQYDLCVGKASFAPLCHSEINI